jgi:tetratricopeptide (TPR) repeat protein
VNHSEEECAGILLSARAAGLAVNGRMVEAEIDAERSLTLLEKRYAGDHPILFRVLYTLAIARFELGKTRTAWQAYRRLTLVRSEDPQYRALVHATTAWLLHSQRKFPEALAEYGKALRDMAEAGLGSSADSAGLYVSRARAFADERQFDLARQELDRATAILTTAKGVVPMDRIVIQQARGRLHARRREWLEAEEDLRAALELADREGAQSAITESTLLEFGVVLRKVHRNAEARTVVARAAGLRNQARTAVVDAAELSLSSTPRKKD